MSLVSGSCTHTQSLSRLHRPLRGGINLRKEGAQCRDRFLDLPTGTGYTAISAGVYASFALTSVGSIVGWGDRAKGRSVCRRLEFPFWPPIAAIDARIAIFRKPDWALLACLRFSDR
jgi:hypothetical protein